jgi:hypothetical protein
MDNLVRRKTIEKGGMVKKLDSVVKRGLGLWKRNFTSKHVKEDDEVTLVCP